VSYSRSYALSYVYGHSYKILHGAPRCSPSNDARACAYVWRRDVAAAAKRTQKALSPDRHRAALGRRSDCCVWYSRRLQRLQPVTAIQRRRVGSQVARSPTSLSIPRASILINYCDAYRPPSFLPFFFLFLLPPATPPLFSPPPILYSSLFWGFLTVGAMASHRRLRTDAYDPFAV